MTAAEPLERYLRRRRSLWADPALDGLDVLLVTTPIHLRWLCGFSGTSGLLLLFPERALLVTDGRYATQSAEETSGVEIHIERQPLPVLLEGRLEDAVRVGFEAARLNWAEVESLRTGRPEREWVAVQGAFERARVVKDAWEVGRLEEAGRLVDQVMGELVRGLGPGSTERQVTGRLEALLREAGSEAFAFEPIVVSGERGALPHGRSSDRKLTDDDLVTIDFGAVVEGYHADITRTVALGPPPADARSWYEAVSAAVDATLGQIRPGIPGGSLDGIARAVIDEAGLGAYFVHNLGHGLGLEVHEEPRLAPGSEQTLVEGMVMTIEPGVYLPGRGGVRIEEDVLVTPQGYRLLTTSSRSFDIATY